MSNPFTCISGGNSALPAPLTPADCDLRNLPCMLLDVRRLRDSNVAALEDPEAFRASVLAWCVAWHQTPAASLPDDDYELARLLGYGRDLQAWRRVRSAGGLHGFTRCNDGRLYHAVVAEKALEAWQRQQFYRERSRRGNAKRWSDRAPILEGSLKDSLKDSFEDSFSAPKEKKKKDNRNSGGAASVSAGSETTSPGKKQRAEQTDNLGRSGFDTFYLEFPKKVDRRRAEQAYMAALRRSSPEAILTGLRRARFSADPKYIPHAATWLNGDRWLDQPPPEPAPNVSVVRGAL